jgi:hypothetical protein
MPIRHTFDLDACSSPERVEETRGDAPDAFEDAGGREGGPDDFADEDAGGREGGPDAFADKDAEERDEVPDPSTAEMGFAVAGSATVRSALEAVGLTAPQDSAPGSTTLRNA